MDSSEQDKRKREAGRAALEFVCAGTVIGVGTGSTTNHFIDALIASGVVLEGAVASSVATARRLRSGGIRVLDLEDVGRLPLYVDGADEATRLRHLIKGGGGALTREKIVAEASESFVCILDESKLVERLGEFPIAVEVIPMAAALVAERIAARGGRAAPRAGFETDNGNVILDARGLDLHDPLDTETWLNQIPGAVANGIFARRPADLLLVATGAGVRRFG